MNRDWSFHVNAWGRLTCACSPLVTQQGLKILSKILVIILPGLYIKRNLKGDTSSCQTSEVHISHCAVRVMDQLLCQPHPIIQFTSEDEQLLTFDDSIDSSNSAQQPHEITIVPMSEISKETIPEPLNQEDEEPLFIEETKLTSEVFQDKTEEVPMVQPKVSPQPVAPKRRRPRSWHVETEPEEEKSPERETVTPPSKPPLATISEGLILHSRDLKNPRPRSQLFSLDSLHEGLSVSSTLVNGDTPKAPPRRRRSKSLELSSNGADDLKAQFGFKAPESRSENVEIINVSRLFAPQHLLVKMNGHGSGSTQMNHPVFVIHSEEGTVHSVTEAMKPIRVPVYGLQCSDAAPLESLQMLASFYIKVRLELP